MSNKANRQLAVNLIAQIASFLVSFGISFFVTPYVTNKLGSDAYGFITLADNFVNYASLITIALNSMASRFITIKIYENKMDEANVYFNSVLIGNTILTIIAGILSVVCVINLEKWINIPDGLVTDVKLTFLIVFLNFMVGIMTSVFSIAFFSTNRLDISSRRSIEANLIRAGIVLGGYVFFSPRIIYVAIASITASIFILVADIHYSRKLLPEIKINFHIFEIRKVIELIEAGIWNVVIKLSQILTNGLDLLISNLFISSSAMGILAIAQTVPNVMSNLIGSIANVFSPEMTIYYAQKDKEMLVKSISRGMRMMTVFTIIPDALLIAFGTQFFRLWMPGQNAQQLCVLAVMCVINTVVSGPIQPLYQVFTITNKVRQNAVAMIIYGIISFLLTLAVLEVTDLGIYAIVG
ncbi:polysaccharide biosynthesis protein [[Bacteroides] pectinophilus ATCC 43243]|uniref:Polysaccharide biosynthesis protein C-terminal domain-containing protein n=2 Tax=[Bacteroides] pectinophilus TaxID=384638 RepID=B7AUI5_9FIRM|nr:polysaccharide biosynthesis protein [[Bacteroides] pectinophilus ATCC 43243]